MVKCCLSHNVLTMCPLGIWVLVPSVIRALHALCPKLQELVLIPHAGKEALDIECVIDMAAARALRGAKLRTVRIIDEQDELDLGSVLELRKYVLHVKCGQEVDVVNDDDDNSDEED